SDDGEFHARFPERDILTTAPIESFGFLDNSHGSIEVNGRGELNFTENATPRALLQVPDGKSLSLIGGDIQLSQGVDDLVFEDFPEYLDPDIIRASTKDDQRNSQLYAPGGRLNLAAIQGAGQVSLTVGGIENTALQSATISMEQKAYLSTTGNGSNVFIHAGEFIMDNSRIDAQVLGEQDGGVVDVQADNIVLDNASFIYGGTLNTGNGTDIHLTAKEAIYLFNHSHLNTESGNLIIFNQPVGDAGDIYLQAQNIEVNLDYSGIFSTNTNGTGRGGDISFIAENQLDIVDASIFSTTWGDDGQAGDAGDLYLQAKTLNIGQGTRIGTTTGGSANAGTFTIEAESIYLGGLGDGLNVQLITSSKALGDSGDIIIRANDILLEDGAYLITAHYGEGNAGDISLQLADSLTVRGASSAEGWQTGIYSNVFSDGEAGKAGDITIQAQRILLEDGGRIDAGSEALHPSTSSLQAGNINLNVQKLELSGVNPYGETRYGFGSAISARSQGQYAGQAGNIKIQADSVALIDGAIIESNTNNTSDSGNIQIQANEEIIIQGDSQQIVLQQPLEAQEAYLSNFNPINYNQSVSGIYAQSTSQTTDSGNSGNIELNTPYLRLAQNGQIVTASQGGGKAGNIELNVERLELDKRTLVRSNSELDNQFNFNDIQTRDDQIIVLGTVVKTNDVGDGKAIYQINLGDTLVNIMPITQVVDVNALQALPEQINMTLNTGLLSNDANIVQVANSGNGQAARFVYTNSETAGNNWHQINENNRIVLTQPDATLSESVYFDTDTLPYASGTLIHIEDIGYGKAADYVYVVNTIAVGDFFEFDTNVLRVKYYQVTDMGALQSLTDSLDIFAGIQADVSIAQDGQPARFVFDGTDWVRYGNVLEVPDVAAREALTLAKPGHIAHLPEGDSIYTGQDWINLAETYRVNNLAERDNLTVQTGDLVKVADIGNGRHDGFLYIDGQWIKQIRGGDAGGIVINADTMQLSSNSEVSTSSISGGGGAITLNIDKMAYLNNSQVSTSVLEGVGNGGGLNLSNPKFSVMNNDAKLIAQAYEGNGGNIDIVTGNYLKSNNSIVDASSQFGISGIIQIDSPDSLINEAIATLPSAFLKIDADFQPSCESNTTSHFSVIPKLGISNQSQDWISAH
ncbi:MAG: hypothetical protein VSS52_007410, partial [Thiotrichaceae bacterium]|nr:hypothetical protein [Thiotrichaceae bacterium]